MKWYREYSFTRERSITRELTIKQYNVKFRLEENQGESVTELIQTSDITKQNISSELQGKRKYQKLNESDTLLAIRSKNNIGQ